MELKDLIRQYHSIKADSQWVKESQNQLLAYFKEKFPLPLREKGHFFIFKPVFASLLILMVILLSGAVVLKAAEKSLPGEPLYFVKRTSENISLKISQAKHRPVLRAEMVQKRLKESQSLAAKGGIIDSKISPQLTKTVYEFQKEFASFKKEIGLSVEKEILFSPDLPIQDNKKIVALVQNQDLEKLLAETKEALKENKVEAALEKTLAVEKIISLTEEKTEEGSEPAIQEEKPIEETKPETLRKLLPTGSLSEIKPKETKPTDFKIEPIQETNSFKTDLMKE